MNRRIGQRIIRDRWGEPIKLPPPNPKRPKPKGWFRLIFSVVLRKSRAGSGKSNKIETRKLPCSSH